MIRYVILLLWGCVVGIMSFRERKKIKNLCLEEENGLLLSLLKV
jgi:hypothetical protein